MGNHKTLYLIDGSGYIFRAYYAIRPLANSKGLPTNAILGFTNMLLKLQREANPKYWAVVFDTQEPTFRDEMYDKYKANRKEPPDDLVPQFEYFPKVVAALNIPLLSQPGLEADDIIATLAKKAAEQGYEVKIISGDKDMMQLVDDKITIWDTMKDRHIARKEVIEKFGVPPEQVIEVQGLMGDSTDNIPGVPGVGPKTAVPLIQEYGSIENLLKNTSKLKGKLKENLEGHADMARLSKELARLKTDADFPFDPEKFLHRPIDTEACHKLFRELEFSKLLSELAPQTKLPRTGYLLIQEEAELEKLVRVIAKQSILAIDLETDSLDVMKANIAGISLGWKKGEAAYIPVGHIGAKQIPLETVKKILEPLFADENIAKVGQNFKYDLAILKRHGFEVGNISGDTMIASYLLNPAGPHNLDALAQQFLDHRTIRYEEVVGTGKQQKLFTEINLERARDYAAEDADCTWQLAQILEPKLKEEGLESLYRNLEIPLMKILLKMEMTGVAVDAGLLKNLSNEFEAELKSREQKIYDLAGGEGSPTQFNINSPKQLGEILFSKLKLPGGKKTKTGFSTSQDVLEDLSEMHELPALILYYRSLSKLKSTYTDSLQNLINQETGRIHTSFNQTIAATGRLSSSDPNLQNIPIRSLEGRRIREAFIAPKGFQLLSADYSQIELRILAHFTEDESLCEAFQKEKDVHSITAAALYGIKPEEVTKEQRAAGKTLNFSVIYGQSPYGLSKQLKIEVSDAALYIENYFKQYPKVKPFREKILEEARRVGYVATLFGRRRFAPDLLSQNFNIRANAERMAFNTVFQGSAADIIKQAMIDIDRELATVSKEAKMILQVHDELLFEVPQKDLQAVQNFVKEKMEKAHLLKIELRVDCGSGKNWAEAH